VRGIIGVTEFKRSLHGVTPSDNRRLHAEALGEWEGRIAAARTELKGQLRSLSLREANGLRGAWYRKEAAALADDPETLNHWQDDQSYLSDLFYETDEGTADREFVADKHIRGDAVTLLSQHGIAADAPVSPTCG
jgi:hypothetical protein